MRTTLKRGIGRGAAVNGNGRAVIPPGALSPVTLYRQPPPSKPGVREARRQVLPLGRAPARDPRLRARRRLLPLGPRDREGARLQLGELQARRSPARPDQGPAPRRGRARDRLRPPRRRRQLALALGHDDADPRRPGHEDDLDALVPARPRRPALLPVADCLGRPHRTGGRVGTGGSTPPTRSAGRRARSRP